MNHPSQYFSDGVYHPWVINRSLLPFASPSDFVLGHMTCFGQYNRESLASKLQLFPLKAAGHGRSYSGGWVGGEMSRLGGEWMRFKGDSHGYGLRRGGRGQLLPLVSLTMNGSQRCLLERVRYMISTLSTILPRTTGPKLSALPSFSTLWCCAFHGDHPQLSLMS